MKFELDELPYAPDALEPHISGKTVDVHYNKHHAGYLAKLADEIQGKPLGELALDELVRGAPADSSMYRNAAQIWNHTFYWNSLAPNGGGAPSGIVSDLVKRDFGSVENFKRRFAETAKARFGSGWAWLVADRQGRLSILSTSNADNPIRNDYIPLLVVDVWEHAYYLDYMNERGTYIEACLDHLLNWQFAESNFETSAIDDSSHEEKRSVALGAK